MVLIVSGDDGVSGNETPSSIIPTVCAALQHSFISFYKLLSRCISLSLVPGIFFSLFGRLVNDLAVMYLAHPQVERKLMSVAVSKLLALIYCIIHLLLAYHMGHFFNR